MDASVVPHLANKDVHAYGMSTFTRCSLVGCGDEAVVLLPLVDMGKTSLAEVANASSVLCCKPHAAVLAQRYCAGVIQATFFPQAGEKDWQVTDLRIACDNLVGMRSPIAKATLAYLAPLLGDEN